MTCIIACREAARAARSVSSVLEGHRPLEQRIGVLDSTGYLGVNACSGCFRSPYCPRTCRERPSWRRSMMGSMSIRCSTWQCHCISAHEALCKASPAGHTCVVTANGDRHQKGGGRATRDYEGSLWTGQIGDPGCPRGKLRVILTPQH